MEREIKERFEEIESRIDDIEIALGQSSLSREGDLVKCKKCKYKWITQSKAKKVTCPSCYAKVSNFEDEKIECSWCRKEVEIKKGIEGYSTLFCSQRCYKKYSKEAKKEVIRGLKKIF